MSVDSPNLEGLDAWAFGPRKVEKPWGHELIWAETERYVGKILFVKAGESLSLQFHRTKDESWLVQAGRAKLELGSAGDAVLNQEVIAAGRRLPLPPRHGPPGHGDRGHDDHRGLDPGARRRGPARGSLRSGGHLRALIDQFDLDRLVVRLAAMQDLTVGEASAQTGWSPRMLRYLEGAGSSSHAGARPATACTGSSSSTSSAPSGSSAAATTWSSPTSHSQLGSTASPQLRAAVETWLAGTPLSALDWEQRKHERLLAAYTTRKD